MVDITKQGKLSYKDLQKINNQNQRLTAADLGFSLGTLKSTPITEFDYEGPERSPLMSDNPYTKPDWLGKSTFDPKEIFPDELDRLVDIRAENQPWYAKIAGGLGKGVVTFASTLLDSIGLPFGVMYGLSNAIQGKGASGFFQGLWDNPIVNMFTDLNEWSEDAMPTYYTQDEMENPLSHIFSASFLGDKIIKNIGFMVGAFYGGVPYAKLSGLSGINKVKKAEEAYKAERLGMAQRIKDIRKGVYGEGLEGKNATNEIARILKEEGLTSEDIIKRKHAAYDRVAKIADTTKTKTQAIGTVVSALNEGIIEASQNSRDWAQGEKSKLYEEYQALADGIKRDYGDSPRGQMLLEALDERFNNDMAEIEKGRAMMGNADMLLNLPILIGSNIHQLWHLYARGFTSSLRAMKPFNGALDKATLASSRSAKKGIASALLKANTEGLEEFLQRAASEGSGNAASDILNNLRTGKSKEAKENAWNFMSSLGKATAESGKAALENIGNPQYIEEYLIGAISAALGMPTVGSNAKNVWVGKEGKFGLSGGVVGNYKEYMREKEKEDKVANYLNGRIKDPKFKAFYDNLIKQNDLDLRTARSLWNKDKKEFYDTEFDKLFQDINAAASAGVLDEFLAMVDYNRKYTDEELASIVEATSYISESAEEKMDKDKKRQQTLSEQIKNLENQKAELDNEKDKEEIATYDNTITQLKDEYDAIQKKIDNKDYQDSYDGPFTFMAGKTVADMTITPELKAKFEEKLNENRERVVNTIKDYLRIRNNIDIETNGMLDDKEIATLTRWQAKIDNLEQRSEDIALRAYDTLSGLPKILKDKKEKLEKELETINTDTKEGKSKKAKKQEELKELDIFLKIFDDLAERKAMSRAEREGFKRGYGDNIDDSVDTKTRASNSDDIGKYISTEENLRAIIKGIVKYADGLSEDKKIDLVHDLYDIAVIAKEKSEYNKMLREYMKDPTLLNDAIKNAEDKLTEEEKEEKIDELAATFKEYATSYSELDRVYREAQQQYKSLAEEALQKAEQTADEKAKALIKSYRGGINTFSNYVDALNKVEAQDDIDTQIKVSAYETFVNAFQSSLDSATYSLAEEFTRISLESATMLRSTTMPENIRQAKIIEDIIKSTEDTLSSVATNNNDDPASEKADKDDKTASDAIRKMTKDKNAQREKASAEAEKGDEESNVVALEDCEKAIKNEMENNPSVVYTGLKDLSKTTSDLVAKYNEKADKDKKIEDSHIFDIYQKIKDAEINNENAKKSKGSEREGEEAINQHQDNDSYNRRKSKEMKESSSISFKSTNPSLYMHGKFQKIPYTINDSTTDKEVLEAVRRVLIDCGAYEFVDSNFLGHLFIEALLGNIPGIEDGKLPITFLKSTKQELLGKDQVFIGLEWSNKYQVILNKYFGESCLSSKFFQEGDNGSKYIILGNLTYDKNAQQAVSDAFNKLITAIGTEVDDKAREENKKDGAKPFVVSSFNSNIFDVFTGMQEMEDSNGKINDLDLATVASNMLEYRDGKVTFPYGVSTGTEIINSDNKVVPPRKSSIEKSPGGVWIYVHKPDGSMYPVRCIRKTVKEWKKTHGHILEDAINGKDTEASKYLSRIVELIKNLTDIGEKRTNNQKITAKIALNRYFTFAKNPIHIDPKDGTVKIYGNTLSGSTLEEVVNNFFDAITSNSLSEKDRNVKFTVPSPLWGDNITGNEIISSGIMDCKLQSLNNFDANFLIDPIDENGNPLNVEVKEGTIEGNDNRGRQRDLRKYVIGNKLRSFYITADGIFEMQGDKEVQVTDSETISIINFAEGCRNANPKSSLLSTLIDQRYKGQNNSKAIIDYVKKNVLNEGNEDGKGRKDKLDRIYMRMPDTASGETKIYIYEQMTNAEGRLYEYTLDMQNSSNPDINIVKKLQNVITSFINSRGHATKIAMLAKEGKGKNDSTLKTGKKGDKGNKSKENNKPDNDDNRKKEEKKRDGNSKKKATGKEEFGGVDINNVIARTPLSTYIVNNKDWLGEEDDDGNSIYSMIQNSDMDTDTILEKLKELESIEDDELYDNKLAEFSNEDMHC